MAIGMMKDERKTGRMLTLVATDCRDNIGQSNAQPGMSREWMQKGGLCVRDTC